MGNTSAKGMTAEMRELGLPRDRAEDNRQQSGLQSPHGRHPFQIAAWCLWVYFNVTFVWLQALYLSGTPLIIACVVFGLADIAVIVFGYIATAIDARDPMLIYIPGEQPQHTAYRPPPYPLNDPKRVFSPKDSRWVYPTSKFCRATRKCVDDFDHHCVWLNNSIGRANYPPFLGALVSAAALVLTQLGCLAAQIVFYATDSDAFESGAEGTGLPALGLLIALCVQGTLLVVGMGFIAQLLGFHGYLVYHGLTTYEFVCDMDSRRSAVAAGLDNYAPAFHVGTAAERRARRSALRTAHAALETDRLRLRALVWGDVVAAVEALGADATPAQRSSEALAVAVTAYSKRKTEVLAGGAVAALEGEGVELPPAEGSAKAPSLPARSTAALTAAGAAGRDEEEGGETPVVFEGAAGAADVEEEVGDAVEGAEAVTVESVVAVEEAAPEPLEEAEGDEEVEEEQEEEKEEEGKEGEEVQEEAVVTEEGEGAEEAAAGEEVEGGEIVESGN